MYMTFRMNLGRYEESSDLGSLDRGAADFDKGNVVLSMSYMVDLEYLMPKLEPHSLVP